MKEKYKNLLVTFVGFFFVICLASNSMGMPILDGSSGDGLIWTANDSAGRSAKAEFVGTAAGFDIYLSSLAASTSVPNQVLAGLFFDLISNTASNPHVTAIGAVTIDGSKYSSNFGSNMDGEWGYLTNIDGINGGLGYYGISSTGFNPESGAPAGWTGFGSTSIIDTTKAYKPPLSPNGAEFGIVSGDISGLVSSISSYVEDTVKISFLYDGFNSSTVKEIHFLYGTDYSGIPVPEPGTLVLLGSGLIGLGLYRRKSFRR